MARLAAHAANAFVSQVSAYSSLEYRASVITFIKAGSPTAYFAASAIGNRLRLLVACPVTFEATISAS